MSAAEALKTTGNERVKAKDWVGALAEYDAAIAALQGEGADQVLLLACRCNRCICLSKTDRWEELKLEAEAVLACPALDEKGGAKGQYYRGYAVCELASVAPPGGAEALLKAARENVIALGAMPGPPKGNGQLRAKWQAAAAEEKARAAAARLLDSSSSYDSDSSNDGYPTIGGGSFVAGAKQMAHYRAGYPGEPDALLNDPSATSNVDFFRGDGIQLPDGFTVEMFHPPDGKFWGNYTALEKMHSYIQWLFPIPEYSKFNQDAQALQRHEAATMRADATCQRNFILNYRCFLDFLGLELVDEATGALQRQPDGTWQARFHNLNTHGHNNLRICRLLKCMGELGFEQYKLPLVEILFAAAYTDAPCTLKNLRDSLPVFYVGTIRDDAVRAELTTRVEAAVAYAADPVFRVSPSNVLSFSVNDAGLGVDVYWPLDRAWYAGVVVKYSDFAERHAVRYADGDLRQHDFSAMNDELVRVLEVVPQSEADATVAAAVDGARRPPLPTTTPASVTDELSAAIGEARRDGDLDGSPAAAAAAADQLLFTRCRALPALIDGAAAAAAAATRWALVPPKRVVTRLTHPLPPLTQIIGKFSTQGYFKGIVVSYDETCDTYDVIFNDGDRFEDFDADDIFHDTTAPFVDEIVEVDGGDDDSATGGFDAKFVQRHPDGSWELIHPTTGATVMVPAVEPMRAVAVPPPKQVPKVLLSDVPSWTESAAMGDYEYENRPSLIVTVSSTKKKWGKRTTTSKVGSAPSLLLSLSLSLSLSRARSLSLSLSRPPACPQSAWRRG